MRDHQPVHPESALAYIPLFGGLSPDEIVLLARGAREIQAEKGRILFRQGETCTGIHVLLYGQAKLACPSSRGAEKIVELVQQGQSFGQVFLFLDRPYSVFAQTLAPSRLLHVPKAEILAALHRNPRFARGMLADMAMREFQLLEDVEAYSLQSGKQRVVSFLVRELHEKSLERGPAMLHLPVAKNAIASRLSLTQEHFSRILHELAEMGLITVAGRCIRIPNVGDLCRFRQG